MCVMFELFTAMKLIETHVITKLATSQYNISRVVSVKVALSFPFNKLHKQIF